MKLVTSTQANRDFSKLLRAVSRGEKVQITSRGRAVAVMAPIKRSAASQSAAVTQLLARLNALPSVGERDWTRDELYR